MVEHGYRSDSISHSSRVSSYGPLSRSAWRQAELATFEALDMPIHNKRKQARFSLRYRVHLKFYSEGRDEEFDGITINLGIGGLLLESPSPIQEHCGVDFSIIAEGGLVIWPLAFAGKGKVVRIDPDPPPGLGYVIALECVHPIEFHRVESMAEEKDSLVRTN